MSVDAAMADLLVRLEQRTVDEAKAFCVVAVDDELSIVLHATGPFNEAEGALVQAGRDEAEWKGSADEASGRDSLRWLVVPLWEPST